MANSRPDHVALPIPSPMEDSSDNRPSGEMNTNSNNKFFKNLICYPKTTLKNVEVFDITRDKKLIATVDSGYMLHVYKIKGNFEDYEEITIFEIYNSKKDEEGDYPDSPQTYSRPSNKGIRICSDETSLASPFVTLCLSISFDGKFVAVSISSFREDQASYNIYSTTETEKKRKIPKLLDRNSGDVKAFHNLRPVFMGDLFIIATNANISIFNLKFDKIASAKNSSYHISPMVFRVRDATCSTTRGTLSFIKDSFDVGNIETLKALVQNMSYMDRLLYMTAAIRQNILIEPCTASIDRIWLPHSRKLLGSINKNSSSGVAAISNNNKYIATVHHGFPLNKEISRAPTFYIYSFVTGLLLNTITSDINTFHKCSVEPDLIDNIIQHVSFHLDDKYIFISGYAAQRTVIADDVSETNLKKMAEKECSYCQLYNISAQRLVYHREYALETYIKPRPLIFIEPISKDSFSVTYVNRNINDELESESFDISVLDTTAIQNQQISPMFKWKEWSPIGNPDELPDEEKPELVEYVEMPDLDSKYHMFKGYVLEYNKNRYILLFGYFSVQMYRLVPIKDDSVDASMVLKSLIGPETKTQYYRFTRHNQLIYIKIYNSVLAGIPHLLNGDELDAINIDDIEVEFDANGISGHTVVTRKQNTSTSGTDGDTNDYFDEIFLPMELITQNTPNMDLFEQSEKNNNRTGDSSENSQTIINNSNSNNAHDESESVNKTKSPSTKSNTDANNNVQGEPGSVNEESATSAQNSIEPDSDVKSESEPVNEDNTLPDQNNEEENPKKEHVGYEFHSFDSVILALYYFESIIEDKWDYRLEVKSSHARDLLTKLIKKYEHTNYFSSDSGSFSLYLLSKIPSLHDFIKQIVLKEDENQIKSNAQIPVSIFSYPETNNALSFRNYTSTQIHTKYDSKPKVNVFTELSKTNRKLFYLLFYHVLMDSRLNGVGNMHAITDLFLFLQRERYLDILLKCTEMLAYFPVPKGFPVLKKGVQGAFNSITSTQVDPSVLSDGLTKEIEEPKSYELKTRFIKQNFWNNMISNYLRPSLIHVSDIFKEDNGSIKNEEPLFVTDEFVSDTRTLCVVPIPGFLSHTPTKQSNRSGSFLSMFKSTDSPFTEIASSKTFNNIFIESNVNIEALTLYKWRAFAGKRFVLILFVHAIYYIAFSTGVAFAKEVFGYHLGDSFSHPGHYTTIIIMFISWFILFVQEIRQFIYNIPAYMNLYNLIDWTALIMPIASLGLLLTDGKYINQVTSTTTLVLWIHAILRLRALKTFGTTLELIIQMSLKTLPFIGAFCSIVVAFTHTLIVLLREKEDDFFQEKFTGALHDSQNTELDGVEINLSDSSSQNDFNNPFKAFSDVWFLIYGVWDPLNDGDAGDDPMITIFSIFFSFIIGLIFFNMIIALMSSNLEKINERGKKNWIHHLAAVVSEVELFWSTPKERFNGVNNPRFVFYIADKKLYEEHKDKLSKEYEKYLKLHFQESKNMAKPEIPLQDFVFLC